MDIKIREKIYLLIFCLIILFVTDLVFADTITLKGSNEVIVGKIIEETETYLVIKKKEPGVIRVPKSLVEKIEKSEIPESELWTDQDIYFQKLKEVPPDDADAHIELGLWCYNKEFYNMAYKHLKIALELNPNLKSKVKEEMKFIENWQAKKFYMAAEKCTKQDYYLVAEDNILTILSKYPESDYAKLAKELLIKIWGQKKAEEIIKQEDDLPRVAIDPRQMPTILDSLQTEECKETYLIKCLNKAIDFEKRAAQILNKDRKKSYINSAIDCYKLIMVSRNIELKNIAHSKIEELRQKI